jgi:hypothetical protein
MLTSTENATTVLAVLADRYRLPLDRSQPGGIAIAEAPGASLPVRAFLHQHGAAIAVVPGHAALVRSLLGMHADVRATLAAVAGRLSARVAVTAARTGVEIPPPAVEVTVIRATDPRLPEWVVGYFSGHAWVVLDGDGGVLSTAVLKRYDARLREIAVGTTERARGRGLARAVVAAAARAVLAEGRAVLYLHDERNRASARVAEAVGLTEIGRLAMVVPEHSRADPEAPL